MSDLSTSPRKNIILVHHFGACDTENNAACVSCSVPGDHIYDFCIARNGDVCDTGQWDEAVGGHSFNCNTTSIGVMMQGCYGGCSGCANQSSFSDQQLCGLAFLSLHLTTPAALDNHRPHRRCDATICCGSNLSTNDTTDRWTTLGRDQMNTMLWMRSNLANGCNCDGSICIPP